MFCAKKVTKLPDLTVPKRRCGVAYSWVRAVAKRMRGEADGMWRGGVTKLMECGVALSGTWRS
jgi:hypothetical protein